MVRITATAFVVREGRILLGRRTSAVHYANLWDAFGGHLEPGERPEDALRRELREEIAIRVTAARSLGEYEDVDPTSKEAFHHHLFLVTGWEGEPRIANDEHSEMRWFRREEIGDLDVAPSLREMIRTRVPGKT